MESNISLFQTGKTSFNVWGKWDNLQNDLKESFQKEVFAGIGRKVTSPIEDAVKGIINLLPSKK
ncbi:MAG: hypothetical protein QMD07_00575 [Thermodesulfovibrionales bacterium]|nr:hypothetical protein [Thermodesulfovibrionales bacterium]